MLAAWHDDTVPHMERDGVVCDDLFSQESHQESALAKAATADAVKLHATSELEESSAHLQLLENQVYAESLEIMCGVVDFNQIAIEDDPKEPPEEWVREMGRERALRRFRTAKAAWMSPKEAPIALQIAKSVTVGLAKARAVERSGGGRSLNMVVAVEIGPAQSYARVEVESND